MTDERCIEIFTDDACLGNPGVGRLGVRVFPGGP